MENTEKLSKAEYNYIRTIEKADELIAKQDASLKKEKSANAELASANAELSKKIEELASTNAELSKKVETLASENEKLKADLDETTKECQLHVDNIEAQNDELEKRIEERKAHILTEEETEKEVKIIYHKQGLIGRLLGRKDKSNWMQQKVLSSDTKRIQSLIDDGYQKKETELPTQLKK